MLSEHIIPPNLTNRQSNTDFKTSNDHNVRGNTTESALLARLHCGLKIKSCIKLSAFNCSYAEVPAFFPPLLLIREQWLPSESPSLAEINL